MLYVSPSKYFLCKRWKPHIKKHGRDIHTEILNTFNKKENLIKEGLKYSNRWNVVNSDEFANLREEEGDGGDTSGFIDYKKMKPMPKGKWKRPDFYRIGEQTLVTV